MAERLTDKVTSAISSMAAALRTYTRASQGLPMTMAKGVLVAVNTTQTLTLTASTDVWVNGIFAKITTAAAGALMIDAKVTRIEISGFLIYDNQDNAQNFFMFDSTGGYAGEQTPMSYKGLANPFVLRQGDVISVTFQNGPTAPAQANVLIDAYRCNRLSPG